MGGSLLLYIVIIIVGIISAFLVSSIAYSKAFKVKNRIISIIEKYDGKCFNSTDTATGLNYDNCYHEIDNELKDIGYSSNISKSCRDIELDIDNSYGIVSIEKVYPVINYNSGHKYCVYKYTLCDTSRADSTTLKCDSSSNKTYYYKVIAFMHFDIPLINQVLEFEVSGENKTFYDTFINIKE